MNTTNTATVQTHNLYCPGCSIGDFPQHHVCGFGDSRTYSVCGHVGPCGPNCHSPNRGWVAPTTTSWTTAPARPCEHCFCQENVGGAKPHDQCCMCFTRRLKAEAE